MFCKLHWKALVLESLFKKIAGWRSATLLKNDSNTGVFLWSLQKFSENLFLQNTSGDCFCTCGGCFYFATLLWRTNNFFFSTHRLRYKKSNSFVYKFVVNCQVFKYLRHGVPYKAENWHAWSREQYFSKHRFLDTSRCAFNKCWINEGSSPITSVEFITGFKLKIIHPCVNYPWNKDKGVKNYFCT